MIAASFLICLAFFLGVGLWSARKSRGTINDYYLASSSVPPWLVGLSAVATNNSGYMFIGVIGFTYAVGLPAIWLMVGWIVGDFIASLYVHRHLREATARTGEVTFGGVLSNWNGQDFVWLRRLAGLITVAFLGAYSAAQLSAGGKALHVLFNWPVETGAVLGTVLLVAYCMAGGIRASIWTDAAQSIVMIVAMAILLWVGVQEQGGWSATLHSLSTIPDFLNWFPADLPLGVPVGAVLMIVGWLFAGLSVAGQPHVMVRFMALNDVSHLTRVRVYYYLWFTAFYAMATGVGLLARLHLPDAGTFDAELALPMMAIDLLPAIAVGLILAGVFAATMSTADSLVLSCSAALTHDLVPHRFETPLMVKLGTLGIAVLALLIAVSGTQSVFALVITAWSVLASAFVPLLLVFSLGERPGERTCITMMAVGVTISLLWRQTGLHGHFYEGMFGIVAGLLVFGLIRLVSSERHGH